MVPNIANTVSLTICSHEKLNLWRSTLTMIGWRQNRATSMLMVSLIHWETTGDFFLSPGKAWWNKTISQVPHSAKPEHNTFVYSSTNELYTVDMSEEPGRRYLNFFIGLLFCCWLMYQFYLAWCFLDFLGLEIPELLLIKLAGNILLTSFSQAAILYTISLLHPSF